MELRQLRYFVRVVEAGSIGRAAMSIGMVTSALSQQISRLESELATRLLTRSTTGVTTTPAGAAFLRQAQLTLRHAEHAVAAAREARLSGMVSVGFAPTTASVLARPFYTAMSERYPNVRLHLVEGLSGNLGELLTGRRLDLAVLFQNDSAQGRSVVPVLGCVAVHAARPIKTSDKGVPARPAWPGPSLWKATQAAAPNPASSGEASERLASIHTVVAASTNAISHGEGVHQAR